MEVTMLKKLLAALLELVWPLAKKVADEKVEELKDKLEDDKDEK